MGLDGNASLSSSIIGRGTEWVNEHIVGGCSGTRAHSRWPYGAKVFMEAEGGCRCPGQGAVAAHGETMDSRRVLHRDMQKLLVDLQWGTREVAGPRSTLSLKAC